MLHPAPVHCASRLPALPSGLHGFFVRQKSQLGGYEQLTQPFSSDTRAGRGRRIRAASAPEDRRANGGDAPPVGNSDARTLGADPPGRVGIQPHSPVPPAPRLNGGGV
jgi:hypothetical protein